MLAINEKWDLLNIFLQKEKNLPSLDFSGADLSGADLSGKNLSNANFSGADLSEANLSHVNLTNADLSDADLSVPGLTVRKQPGGVDFSGFYEGRINSDARGGEIEITPNEAQRIGINFVGADLSYANLKGANLVGANLAYANVSNVNQSKSDARSAPEGTGHERFCIRKH